MNKGRKVNKMNIFLILLLGGIVYLWFNPTHFDLVKEKTIEGVEYTKRIKFVERHFKLEPDTIPATVLDSTVDGESLQVRLDKFLFINKDELYSQEDSLLFEKLKQ